MATIMHGKSDSIVTQLKAALESYEKEHPGATAAVYRQNSASVRVRVIDERFAGMSRADRFDQLYDYLAGHVDEEAIADVSVLLAFAPQETEDSLANMDFEHPLPSML